MNFLAKRASRNRRSRSDEREPETPAILLSDAIGYSQLAGANRKGAFCCGSGRRLNPLFRHAYPFTPAVAMEACGNAHFWGRRLLTDGRGVRRFRISVWRASRRRGRIYCPKLQAGRLWL
jgi:hypothetical protein